MEAEPGPLPLSGCTCPLTPPPLAPEGIPCGQPVYFLSPFSGLGLVLLLWLPLPSPNLSSGLPPLTPGQRGIAKTALLGSLGGFLSCRSFPFIWRPFFLLFRKILSKLCAPCVAGAQTPKINTRMLHRPPPSQPGAPGDLSAKPAPTATHPLTPHDVLSLAFQGWVLEVADGDLSWQTGLEPS